MRPPSPVHGIAERGADGALTIRWTRRSRAGWAWIDGVDAPLGEAGELYRLTLGGGGGGGGADGGGGGRVVEVGRPEFVYGAADRAADGVAAGTALAIEVVQVGALAASRALQFTVTA